MKIVKPRRAWGWARFWGLGVLVVSLLLAGGYMVATQNAEAAAKTAMFLRSVIGDQAVAQLETIVYAIKDTFNQLEARAGLLQAPTPWAEAPIEEPTRPPRPSATATARPAVTPTPPPNQAQAAGDAPSATPGPATSTPTSTPTATLPWNPTPIDGFTSMKDEGQWQAYIEDGAGQTVAYRTRLFPDRTRLYYAEAVVVAFDLSATRLHFALGKDEPKSPVQVERTGKIPDDDLKLGHLLAAFNGGFLAEHGFFGAMSNGVTVLPPRDGLATVAMYDDGQVKLGAWGRDIITDTRLVSWRQNGPLLIDNGQINPETTVGLPRDWGYSVNGETVVWRSALGLSADQRTLYYVAGPNLTLPILAKAMAATGAQFAMQLDINDYWVFFCTFYPDAQDPNHIQTRELHLVMRYKNRDRYLKGFERDFFYITSANY
jgi:hypothetical protein